MNTATKEISSLTVLRAFAAWWVVIYHFKKMVPGLSHSDAWVLNAGWFGVDIFFVLSGFVLSHVYGVSILLSDFNYRHFLRRRFARIYPLHLAVLLIFLLICGASLVLGLGIKVEGQLTRSPDYDPVTTILAQIFLIHAWGVDKIGHFNTPSWSISAEWFAYLLFPVLARFWLRTRMAIALAAGFALLGAVTGGAHLLLDKSPYQLVGDFGMLRILPEFVFGILVFRLWTGHSAVRGCAWIAAGLGLLVLDKGGDLVPIAAALVVYGMAGLGIKTRFLRYLGEISYSTYMVHLLVMIFCWPLFNRFPAAEYPLLAGALLATFGASVAAYHCIELPARAFLLRAGAFRRTGRSPMASARA